MKAPLSQLKPAPASKTVPVAQLRAQTPDLIPESPGTLQIQLEQLVEGKRRAVMFPKGTPLQKRPSRMKAYQDANGNTFIFNPKLTSQPLIDKAIEQNQLPELLGATDGGMGAPDKTELKEAPVSVVARDEKGETAQGTLTDQAHLPETLGQAEKLKPAGGDVQIESPNDELAHRLSAANDGKELTRGTSDIPLTPDGEMEAADVGAAFQKSGGLQKIYHGPLERTRDTAVLVGRGKTPLTPVKGLRPWALGSLEAKPEKDTHPIVERLMKETPDVAPPGKGPLSQFPGESHNQFIRNFALAIRPIMTEWEKNPTQKIGVVTHSRNFRVLRALLDAGFPARIAISKRALDDKVPDPGQVERLFKADGKWQLEKADPAKANLPGIYMIRHGETEWNKGAAPQEKRTMSPRPPAKPRPRVQSKPASSAAPNPAEQIHQLVMAGKYQEAIKAAQLALRKGLITERDIDQAIDRAEQKKGPLAPPKARPGQLAPPPPPRPGPMAPPRRPAMMPPPPPPR